MKKTWFLLPLVSCSLLSACQNDLDDARKVTSRANVNIERGKNLDIVYSSLGQNKMKAYAPTSLRFNTEKPYVTFPDGIKVDFYNEFGQVGTVMTAKHATMQDGSSLMVARND